MNRDRTGPDKNGTICYNNSFYLVLVSWHAVQPARDSMPGIGVPVVHAGLKDPVKKRPVFLLCYPERLTVCRARRRVPAQNIIDFHCFPPYKKPRRNAGAVVYFINVLQSRQIIPAGKYTIKNKIQKIMRGPPKIFRRSRNNGNRFLSEVLCNPLL